MSYKAPPLTLRVTVLALASLVAACTEGPDFHAPHADVPAQWDDPQQAASAASAASEAVASRPTEDSDPDPHWWHTFCEPTLDALIDRATQGNLDLQEAVLRIVEARIQVQSAASRGLPMCAPPAVTRANSLASKVF